MGRLDSLTIAVVILCVMLAYIAVDLILDYLWKKKEIEMAIIYAELTFTKVGPVFKIDDPFLDQVMASEPLWYITRPLHGDKAVIATKDTAINSCPQATIITESAALALKATYESASPEIDGESLADYRIRKEAERVAAEGGV